MLSLKSKTYQVSMHFATSKNRRGKGCCNPTWSPAPPAANRPVSLRYSEKTGKEKSPFFVSSCLWPAWPHGWRGGTGGKGEKESAYVGLVAGVRAHPPPHTPAHPRNIESCGQILEN